MTSHFPVPLLPVLIAALGLPAGAAARWLLGRLRRGARVHPPWCELSVALAWGLSGAAAVAGVLPWRWLPVLLGLGWLAVAAGAVDLLHHRLPDAVTLPALPLALLLLAPVGAAAVLRGLAGAAVAVAVYGAVHLASPAAMGAGDVKLAAPLGAVLAAESWPALALGAVVAALLSGVLAVAALVNGRSAVAALLRRRLAVAAPASGGQAVAPPGHGCPTRLGCRASGWRALAGRRGRRALVGRRGSGRPAGAERWRPRRVAVPHGPSMLLATWLVATAAAGARGP